MIEDLQDFEDVSDSQDSLDPSDLVDVTLFGELSLRPAAPLVVVEPVDPAVILPSVAWVWDDFDDEDLAEIPDDDVKVRHTRHFTADQ